MKITLLFGCGQRPPQDLRGLRGLLSTRNTQCPDTRNELLNFMAQAKEPDKVALIVGMLSMQEKLFAPAEEKMQTLWGPTEFQSNIMPFDFTDYYAKEMSTPLLRKFVSFAQYIDPGELADIKHQSNALEDDIAQTPAGQALGVSRPINLDPGYVEPSKLVLATTKNYSHRIYIGKSMYAECTLHYHKGRWQSWPFTYPDYAGGAYYEFLSRVRKRLMEQRSSQKSNT